MAKKYTHVVVNRAFLMDLANTIYDTKSRKFLRLCDGTLQNGPDPEDEERPMHCGLGELYFAMTGEQPKTDKVDEDDVVNLAVELSTLPDEEAIRKAAEKELKASVARAVSVIKALKLPEALQDNLVSEAEGFEPDSDDDEGCEESAETRFREALDAIPGRNDDGCGDDSCNVKTLRERSQRVAAKLREAAKILPA